MSHRRYKGYNITTIQNGNEKYILLNKQGEPPYRVREWTENEIMRMIDTKTLPPPKATNIPVAEVAPAEQETVAIAQMPKPDAKEMVIEVAQFETITPALALKYLEKNVSNRPLKKARIKDYAADMESGKWKQTHEPIAFDWHGNLVDGQHRLKAIIASSKTLSSVLVVRNVDPDTRYYCDQGKSRTPGDHLSISGMNYRTNDIAATVRCMIGGLNGPNANEVPTGQDLTQAATLYQEGALFAISAFPSNRRLITTAPVKGVIARAYYYENKARLQKFCDIIFSGIITREEDGMAVLFRNFCFQNAGVRNGSSVIELYAKAARALKGFINEEKLTRLHSAEEEYWELPTEAEIKKLDKKKDVVSA